MFQVKRNGDDAEEREGRVSLVERKGAGVVVEKTGEKGLLLKGKE